MLAWGKKVSKEFANGVITMAGRLNKKADPSDFMACMAFESGRTFSPSVRNAAGSGAVGLIQFMPSTAHAMGTTVEALAAMTNVQQLVWVERYFKPSAAKLVTLEDIYMTILWPAAAGKPNDYVLFNKANPKYPKRYLQNAGLDFNRDGLITKGEAAAKVRNMLVLGLKPENCLL